MLIEEINAQADIKRSVDLVFSWNKILLSCLGLWPAKASDLRFAINFGYFVYQMILEYLDLFLFIDNLDNVIMNLTENMAFSQIFIRMLMLRIYNRELGGVITEAMKDVHMKHYTGEEKKTFVAYYEKSSLFMKLLMSNTALTATSFYMKPILGQMGTIFGSAGSEQNATFVFLLPYRFYTFYEIKDMSTYLWTYGSQMPFVFVSGFGQSAADCLMITLVYHVSGQLSVLAKRIANISSDPEKCSRELRTVVKDHTRLLRMGMTIEKAFSVTLLGHLLGATSLVCILGYQILISLAMGENAVLISFFAFIFLVLLVLCAHCAVSESLITESTKVCEAFYGCDWCNMSKENAAIVLICMARSQKPLYLTAGKFTVVCLRTITDVLRASMGYLSVLRSLM